MGEISAIALLLGGAYMLYKHVITWHIPVAMLGTIATMNLIFYTLEPSTHVSPIIGLLSGGTMLGEAGLEDLDDRALRLSGGIVEGGDLVIERGGVGTGDGEKTQGHAYGAGLQPAEHTGGNTQG